MSMLEVNNINTFYGKSHIIQGLSLSVEEGEAVALLGRNGVGKTTTIRSIIGFTPPRTGDILFKGKQIARRKPESISRMGMGLVPQGRRVFPNLTVKEHLVAFARARGPWTLERLFELFPRLSERRGHFGNQLSGGEQQMLAIARALVINPKLMLLDEPTEGLAPIIVDELLAALKRIIRGEGMSAIVVEQHAQKILGVTDNAVILDRGTIVHAGSSRSLIDDPAALELHLGVTAKKKPARMSAH